MDRRLKKIIKNCKNNVEYFIENFCKVKHPTAGILPFKLFDYQRKSLKTYQEHRFIIYKKTRQCGISTISGAFALWFGMFKPHSTILIVSKTDRESKEYLGKNVVLPYKYLPREFREIWGKKCWNQHEINFNNGSAIKSLPSTKDVLRSNSSTLNIIDEVAFIDNMDDIWTGGASTLTHGGQCICISTTKGRGNWYYNTWEGAVSGTNNFYPLEINWWEMDWEIKYYDQSLNKEICISPTAGIRKTTEDEKELYGPYWSPWLEEQLRLLKQKEGGNFQTKFRQEVLADFIGSGNTVIPPEILRHIETTVDDEYGTIKFFPYIHPATGERIQLDFQDNLKIWKKPVKPTEDRISNGKEIIPGEPGHTYVIGCDVSTGEGSDFSTFCVLDVTIQEQVAELNIKVSPSTLTMMLDAIARWYNNALCVIENTGIGAGVSIDIEKELGYYNVYRPMNKNGHGRAKRAGFSTTGQSKSLLNKTLMDYLGEDGYVIKSRELSQQMNIYVYLNTTGNKTGAEHGSGNHDDLVLACALALIGTNDAIQMNSSVLVPTKYKDIKVNDDKNFENYAEMGGNNLITPLKSKNDIGLNSPSIQDQFDNFSRSLGGITKQQSENSKNTSYKKYIIKKNK